MKFFKYLFIFTIIAGLFLLGLYFKYDESIPGGVSGPKADKLALDIMNAASIDQWRTTGAIQWEFTGSGALHKHLWDKDRHFAEVEFDGQRVQIDINNRRGRVMTNVGDNSVTHQELCAEAWKLWTNDSFWLNPLGKLFDPGTTRKIVEQENGQPALLITYASGGVTPGDSYLWILSDNNLPSAWKFWVSIIPIGGLEFSWEDWIRLETGAMISTRHRGLIDIGINNVRGKKDLLELTGDRDVFQGLESASVVF